MKSKSKSKAKKTTEQEDAVGQLGFVDLEEVCKGMLTLEEVVAAEQKKGFMMDLEDVVKANGWKTLDEIYGEDSDKSG